MAEILLGGTYFKEHNVKLYVKHNRLEICGNKTLGMW